MCLNAFSSVGFWSIMVFLVCVCQVSRLDFVAQPRLCFSYKGMFGSDFCEFMCWKWNGLGLGLGLGVAWKQGRGGKRGHGEQVIFWFLFFANTQVC